MIRNSDTEKTVRKEKVNTHRPWTQEAGHATPGHTRKHQGGSGAGVGVGAGAGTGAWAGAGDAGVGRSLYWGFRRKEQARQGKQA